MKNIILPIAVVATVLLPGTSDAQVTISPDQTDDMSGMPMTDMFRDPIMDIFNEPMGMFHDPFAPFDVFFEPPPMTTGFAKRRMNNGYQRPGFYPRMDVASVGDKIEIRAELPGMDEKDIILSLDNHVLTIKGERKREQTEENKNYYLKESSSGYFSQAVRLPKNIDESKIDAVFKNGVLTITVPKLPDKEDTAKKIPVRKG